MPNDPIADPAQHWMLAPDVVYLNHGSYGATPRVVLQEQQRLRDALERNPVRFLSPERELEPRLDVVRRCIAGLVGAPADDIAFVRNATDGVNAVLRSMPLAAGDEIVVTSHGYNACINAARFAAERHGAFVRMATVPFPLTDEDEVVAVVESAFTEQTRLLLVDHVTSPTGLVLPVARLIAVARARGIRVLVDGAHAPGMLPLDLNRLEPDYYTANHHKWLCAPKASGFLYVAPRWQAEVRPTVISHGANRPRPGRSRFISEFDWTGTFDPSALLAVPAAVAFLGALHDGGIDALMRRNRERALVARERLCQALDVALPAPETMIGSLASVPLPTGYPDVALQAILRERHGIEVPVIDWPAAATRLVRLSMQAYNHPAQVERLIAALQAIAR